MTGLFKRLADARSRETGRSLLVSGEHLLMVDKVEQHVLRGAPALVAEFMVLWSNADTPGARRSWVWTLTNDASGDYAAGRAKQFAKAMWHSVGWAPTNFSVHPDQLVKFLEADSWRGSQLTAIVETGITKASARPFPIVAWHQHAQVIRPDVGRALLEIGGEGEDLDTAFAVAETLALSYADSDPVTSTFWMGTALELRDRIGAR